MLLNRVLLLLVSTLALLGSAEPLGKLDPHDLLGYIHRLQHSTAPEARAIVLQIENGPHELALQRAAARREGIPLTPAQLQEATPPPALNAAPVYEQLMRLQRDKPTDPKAETLAASMGTRYTHTPEELATVRKFLLVDRRDVLDLIHQAADRPQCVFSHKWDPLVGMVLFPEYATMRNAERRLQAESYVLAQEGRYREAIDNQARGFRIAAHAAAHPDTISSLVGIACDALTLDGMRDILYMAGPNAKVADQVRTTIASSRPRFSLRHMLKGEVVTQLGTMEMLRRLGPKGLAEYLTDKPVPRFRKLAPGEQKLFQNLWDAAEADYLRQMRHAMTLADQPYPARLTQFKRLDQQFARLYATSPNHPVRRLISTLPLEAAISVLGISLAREEVVIAAAAVLAYRARHSAWPDHLEEALPDPPLDPFSSEPVKYRREGEGFVVYSVGPTGKNTGTPPTAGRRATVDFFHYPPPPPQPHPSLPTEGARPVWAFVMPPKNAVQAIAFSPDGKWVVSGSPATGAPNGDVDQKLRLWEVQTGKLLWSKNTRPYSVFSVAFSPEGQMIATGSGEGKVALWDAVSGKLHRTLPGHQYCVNSVAFSPDGRQLASVGSDTLKLWEVKTGRLLRTLSGHSIWVEKGRSGWLDAVTFSPDGRLVAAGSHDYTVKLWSARTGRLLRTFTGHGEWVTSVAFSPDGRWLVSSSGDGTLKLWDPRTGKPRWTTPPTGWVNSVAFSPDGKWLASAYGGFSDKPDSAVRLWDSGTGRLLHTIKGHRGPVNSIAISPDGRRVASGSDDGTVKVWVPPPGLLQRTLAETPE
jgi:hypothetical protein